MKNPFSLSQTEPRIPVLLENWKDWKWQFRKGLKSLEDYSQYFDLSEAGIKGFSGKDNIFRVQVTPYYASLASREVVQDPIRQMIVPHESELHSEFQQMDDPLAKTKILIDPVDV